METFCSFCGKQLDEKKAQGNYIACCNKFTPIGANSYNKLMKGGIKMAKNEEIEGKKESKKTKILAMLKDNKTMKEIKDELNVSSTYISYVKAKNEKISKKET